MITNGKKQPFHSNAVVFNKADRSLQHKAVRLFIFKVLLDFCFHFFLRVQRPAKTSQPQNRVFSDELQKHDYLHFKKKRRSLSFYSGAAKKKKKIPSLFHFPCTCSPPPLNICPSMTSPLQTAQCNLSHLSTHVQYEELKASLWSDSI